MKNNYSKTFKKSLAAVAVTAILGFSSSVFADTGALKIQIKDISGQPVAGATVYVHTAESLTTKQGITDANGYVRLVGLDPSRKYEVEVKGNGFDPIVRDKVKVVSGKSFNLSYIVGGEQNIEKIEVRGTRNAAVIDTETATVGLDITLDLTESLPTGRSFTSYLQLAPGTMPSTDGNAASKSGVNYRDVGGTVGSSTDNIYYLDGVNVTDNSTGKAGADINSEIIQEQQIYTGAIPAEFSGGSGLVTRVVTKSGSNEFHGSYNYYFQNDNLVADHKHEEGNVFSTFDTAFTLGGPIIKDELWFFVSYQEKHRTDEVFKDAEYLRPAEEKTKLGFAKLTWQPTEDDKLSVSFFNDPQTISNSQESDTPNNRDEAQKYGGNNYKFEYSHSWEDVILTLKGASHEGESSFLAADTTTRGDVAYFGYNPTTAESFKGGLGSTRYRSRDRTEFHVTLEYFLDTDFGYHSFKSGYAKINNENFQNEKKTGSDAASYNSIGSMNAGTMLADYAGGSGWVGNRPITEDDYARINDHMMSSSDYSYYLGLLDSDGSGGISDAEMGALTFSDTGSNPYNDVSVYRSIELQAAPVTMEVKGQEAYIQDNWNYEDLSINLGFRAEKWEHFSSEGDKIATFDWDIAHRLSVIYDVMGDGESKIFAFHGRYYDPVRSDMTDFAGNLTGPVVDEQLRVGDKWLTFRTRGGTGTQDAFFSPTTKTPYTDELLIGYSRTLTDDIGVEVTYTNRKTRDIMEDFDLGVYAEDLEGTDYYLPYSYFGYDSNPGSNYVIATLKGGKRDYQGVEFSVKKFRSDNWLAYASYTYNKAEGNSNSDGNADLQGDLVYMDPRSPGAYGPQPGSVEHLFKAYGSYNFDNGVELGFVYNWNSGALYTRAMNQYRRYIPVRVDEAYSHGGHEARWMKEGLLGSEQAPSYGTLDMRVKYTHDFGNYKAEVFLDINNVFDDQAITAEMPLVDGDDTYSFAEGTAWVAPRRLYIGARVTF